MAGEFLGTSWRKIRAQGHLYLNECLPSCPMVYLAVKQSMVQGQAIYRLFFS